MTGLSAQRPRPLLLMMGGGVALAVLAQWLLDRQRLPLLAAGLMAVGAGLFAWANRHVVLERPRALHAGVDLCKATPWPWLAPVIALGAWAFAQFGGNRLRAQALLPWAMGLALLLWVGGWRWREATPGLRRLWRSRRSWAPDALILGAILALGAFFRFHRIAEIPLEMGCDLPLNQFNIADILSGRYPIFFPRYPGREGLFFYLAAPLCALFGLSHVSIKVSSALISLMAIPLIYLLGRELYNRRVGLWAAFLLSISHWHIILSRTGFRSCALPPMLIALLYFLARGLRMRRLAYFGAAGLFLGLGFYTYNAFMVAPLLVAAVALFARLTERWRRSIPLRCWVVLACVALYVMIPLGRYALDEPQQYLYRVATRMTALEAPLPDDPIKVFVGNVGRTLGMFNVRGDAVFINNVPYHRELGFVSAICFILGAAYALARGWRGPGGVLLLALGVLLLPSMLSLAFPHETPNAGRAIGALPPALLLAALPPALIQERLAPLLGRAMARSKRSVAALGLALLAGGFAWEAVAIYPLYFRNYVWHLPDHNYSISLAMARVIDDFAGQGEAYIRAWPHWYDGNAVRAQLRRADPGWSNELSELAPDRPPFVGPPGRFVVILHPEDQTSLGQLRQAFPDGLLFEHQGYSLQTAFLTFYGERRR